MMVRFLFIASLTSLLAVGCGDDKDDNVVSNFIYGLRNFHMIVRVIRNQ